MKNDYSYCGYDFKFDIHPKVFEANKETVLTVECETGFDGKYSVQIVPMMEGASWAYGERNNKIYMECESQNSALKVTYNFPDESEYLVSITKDGKFMKELSVYAVADDLVGRYPFMGDLHVHSNRSDGKQSVPDVVVNYRKNGYDFFALTDHNRYYPSLEAMEFAEKCGTDMKLFPGEEVHIGITDIHTVNFGGAYSVNALHKHSPQCNETGVVPENSLTSEELALEVKKIADSITVPEGVEKRDVAACKWIFDKIRDGGGIAIYAHPFWRKPEYHVPSSLNDHLLERRDFDVFEVLGGERYFDQNGLQVIKYYEMKEKGIDFPVVGSSDSHNVTGNERNALIARTLVLSRSCSFEDLKDAILSPKHYSVPVDLRPHDFGIIAPFRIAMYASFLIRCYFPIHDKLCFDEGELMKKCINGTETDFEASRQCSGGIATLFEKYFKF